jgi:hypothetical protein
MTSADLRFRAALGLASALVVLPLWVGEYMPLVDLPQHAVELSIAQHWGDPAYGYPSVYQVNPLINQLLAPILAYAFGWFLPLSVAIKCVLTLVVLALPASVGLLTRAVGGDRWWTLLAFPLGYGFPTYWGFFAYIVAVPLGLVLVARSARYAQAPSRGSALGLFALSLLLFLSHVLVLAFAGLTSGLIVLLRSRGIRAKGLGALALCSVLPLVAAWWFAVQRFSPHLENGTQTTPAWSFGRLQDLLSYQVDLETVTPASALIGALLFAGPFLLGARPAREGWRWIPLGVSLSLFLFMPLHALRVAFLYGRYAIFVLPGLLFALRPGPSPLRFARAGVTALVAAHLLTVAWTFRAFDAESAGLKDVLAALAPYRRLLYLDTYRHSDASFNWAYLHFGCWYQVERGGPVDVSFAKFFSSRYLYRAETFPSLPDNLEWSPLTFRWAQHGGDRYDYVLVRGGVPREWFPRDMPRLVVVAHSGQWIALGREGTTP